MKRLGKDTKKLTERDLKAFRVIGEMGRISLDLLQIWLPRLEHISWNDDGSIAVDLEGFLSFSEEIVETTPLLKRRSPSVSLTRVYQWVKPLVEAGLLVYDAKVLIGQKTMVGTTPDADALIGRKYLDKGSIPLHEYDHNWTVNFMRLWMELWLSKRGFATYTVKTERVKIAESGNTELVYPDFEVWFGDTHDAIEIETTKKGKERYQLKKRSYRAYPVDRKLYYCPAKKLELIKMEFAGEIGYYFLPLEFADDGMGQKVDRCLENGTKYTE